MFVSAGSASLPFSRIVVVAVCLPVIGGCANRFTAPILSPLLSTGSVNTTAANQFFDEDAFEKVNLLTLLDPERLRDQAFPAAKPPTTDPAQKAIAAADELERAFRAFYRYGGSPEERRSRVQDRILAASEQRCNTYKNYIKSVETFQGTTAGILTTILGGAGAIVTPATTARALSGLAGITSGIGAELRQGFFSNVASQVIVPGIDVARADLRREMLDKRSQPISTYTVEAALVDTARYHGACSLNAGLDRAGVAVREVANPGLRMLNLTLGQLNVARRLGRRLNDDTIDITTDVDLASSLEAGTPLAQADASGAAARGAGTNYLDRYMTLTTASLKSLEQLRDAIRARAKTLADKNAADPDFAKATNDEECKKLKAGAAECTARLTYTAALADPAAQSGAPVPVPVLIAKLSKQPAPGLIKTFRENESAVRTAQAQLGDTGASQIDQLERQHAFLAARTKANNDFAAQQVVFVQVRSMIAIAQNAVAGNDAEALKKALGSLDKLIDTLPQT